MPKRNKLQLRRYKRKKEEKQNRINYYENQKKYQEYANQIFNEGLQLIRMNRPLSTEEE